MGELKTEELEFFDVKTRTKFKTTEWRIETREARGQTRYFAVAKAPGGHEAWRIISKALALRILEELEGDARDKARTEARA